MSEPEIILYHCPDACSQVVIYALEKAGAQFRVELVNLYQGEQKTPAYLAISPLGKVPLLRYDGALLAENAAILTLIGTRWPHAGIWPANPSDWARAERIGGLSFCGGTLHPLVRGMANPQRLTTGDVEPVREMSRALFAKSIAYAEDRLADRGWWLGERSVVDVYLHWVLSVARRAGFDFAAYRCLDGLRERLLADAAFERMLEREETYRRSLCV